MGAGDRFLHIFIYAYCMLFKAYNKSKLILNCRTLRHSEAISLEKLDTWM